MNNNKKPQRLSYTYSLPSIVAKRKSLKTSGMAIIKNFDKPEVNLNPRYSIKSEGASPTKPTIAKYFPYFYAQNPILTTCNLLPFSRKVADNNILTNKQMNQLRSATDYLLY